MNICDDLSSACSSSSSASPDTLFEQIGRRVLETIGEDGPLVAILDGEGNCWSSDEQRFNPVAEQRQLLDAFCGQIGDGCEPFVGSIDGWEVVGTQLHTERMRCAYVLIGLAGFDRDSTVANMPLIEMLLNQINVIAALIDNNNQLHPGKPSHLGQTANIHQPCVN